VGKVFITTGRTPDPAEVEGVEPYADVPWLGEYFFLYPQISQLEAQSGELIDPQKDAFFVGSALDALEGFLELSRAHTLSQPESWEQRVGRQHPSGEVVFIQATRDTVIAFLDGVQHAVSAARAQHKGVFFYGE
jgi:hypothetical protein